MQIHKLMDTTKKIERWHSFYLLKVITSTPLWIFYIFLNIFEYYMHSVHLLHLYICIKIYSLIINPLLYISYILSRVMSIPCIFYTLKFPVKMHPNIQFSRESSPSSLASSDSSQSWSPVSRLISVRTRKAAKWKKGLAYRLFFPSAGPVSSICGYLATCVCMCRVCYNGVGFLGSVRARKRPRLVFHVFLVQ